MQTAGKYAGFVLAFLVYTYVIVSMARQNRLDNNQLRTQLSTASGHAMQNADAVLKEVREGNRKLLLKIAKAGAGYNKLHAKFENMETLATQAKLQASSKCPVCPVCSGAALSTAPGTVASSAAAPPPPPLAGFSYVGVGGCCGKPGECMGDAMPHKTYAYKTIAECHTACNQIKFCVGFDFRVLEAKAACRIRVGPGVQDRVEGSSGLGTAQCYKKDMAPAALDYPHHGDEVSEYLALPTFDDIQAILNVDCIVSKYWDKPLTICLYPKEKDVYVSGEVHKGQWFEPSICRAAVAWLTHKGGDLIDVGGNIGSISLRVASAMPGSQVHTFEPLSSNAAMLREAVRLNKFTNAHINQCILSNSKATHGNVPHWQDGTGNFGSVKSSDNPKIAGESSRSTKLRVCGLDTYVEHLEDGPKISFVKMDCEGCEGKALLSAEAMFAKHLPVVQLEVSPDYLTNEGTPWLEVWDRMIKLGYALYNHSGKKVLNRSDNWANMGGQEDVYFVHKDDVAAWVALRW